MSVPDYKQTADDHQRLIVLVKKIGNDLNNKAFNKLLERVEQLDDVRISDAQGLGFERKVLYKIIPNDYSPDNNEWGDFQAHRRVFGLITIGRASPVNNECSASNSDASQESQKDTNSQLQSISAIDDLLKEHDEAAMKYSSTLYNSRCFIISDQGGDHPSSSEICRTSDKIDKESNLPISGDPGSPTDGLSSLPSTAIPSSNGNKSDTDSEKGPSSPNQTSAQVEQCHSLPSPAATSPTSGSVASSKSKPMFRVPKIFPKNNSSSNISSSNTSLNSHALSSSSSSLSPAKKPVNQSKSPLNGKTPLPNFHRSLDSLPSQRSSGANGSNGQVPSKIPRQSVIISDEDLSSTNKFEENVRDFFSSLFWVLESKRLDRSQEKQDKIPLLLAPFEKKDIIGLDTDSRNYRNRCFGRMKKQLGDLSLLAGLPSEALTHYSVAVDQLKSVSDWLWLGAALEGQCVASLVLLYPEQYRSRRRSSTSLQRNASMPPSNISKHRRMASETSTASNAMKTAIAASFGPTIVSTSSKSLPNGLDPVLAKALGKSILSPSDIYDKYKEAACHYAKYRNAAIVELECSFKAARVLTDQGRMYNAAEFIQNAVFISFQQTNDEQIERLAVIAELYANIGYHRKAAFYKRFAALKAVSIHLEQPNWRQCYYLMMPALEGYHLTLDPLEYDRRQSTARDQAGWPGIHLQLMQELITTSKRMGAESLAIRHLSFALHALFEYLPVNLKRDIADQLMVLSAKCGEGAPVPLTLDNGYVIPSVNFTKFPSCLQFKVLNVAPHLRPFTLKSALKSQSHTVDGKVAATHPSSPFIYTPIHYLGKNNPSTPRKTSTGGQILDFKWVEGESGSVSIQFQNPLPLQLNVSHLALMLGDGVACETVPIQLTFEPESVSQSLSLAAIPQASGVLNILGYSTHVLGLKSNCRVKDLPIARNGKMPNYYSVEVVPGLPLIAIGCSLDKKIEAIPQRNSQASDDCPIIETCSMVSFAGERKNFSITLANNSTANQVPIEFISVKVVKPNMNDERSPLRIKWKEEDITSKLPLAPGSSLTFEVFVDTQSDFVYGMVDAKSKSRHGHDSFSRSKLRHSSVDHGRLRAAHHQGSHSNSLLPQVGSQSASLFSSPLHTPKRSNQLLNTTLNFISDLQNTPLISSNQNQSQNCPSPDTRSSKQKLRAEEAAKIEDIIANLPKRRIESVIEIEYAGGPGFKSNYCRKAAIKIDIDVRPSLLITHWDVMPADTPSNCFIVLDILNATETEMELEYAKNKEILIESHETCRIPVPVARCPQLEASSQESETIPVTHSTPNNHSDTNGNITKHAEDLESRCKRHVIEQVELKWSLPATGVNGFATLESIKWTQSMTETLLLPSIQWHVTLNEDPLIPNNEYQFRCGQVLMFKVALENCSGKSLKDLTLSLQCYQDNQNGHKNYRIEMKRSIIGTDKLFISEIAPNEKHYHECGFVFYYAGLYKIDIQCSSDDESSATRRTGRSENRRSPHIIKSQQSSSNLWKCTPAIELNILEA